jgi:predicted Fe-S protein YdhL (DUF1289 family)
MKNNKPKPETGYYYELTSAQLEAGKKRTIDEIFQWLEETNRFIWEAQTPEERNRVKKAKNMTW